MDKYILDLDNIGLNITSLTCAEIGCGKVASEKCDIINIDVNDLRDLLTYMQFYSHIHQDIKELKSLITSIAEKA